MWSTPPAAMPDWLWRKLRLWMRLDDLQRLNLDLASFTEPSAFAEEALKRLGVRYEANEQELRHIPTRGPVIVVANHPLGGIDGLIALAVLLARRPDTRLLATAALQPVAALAPVMIAIENLDPHSGRSANASALRCALRALHSGQPLLVFPAGEVAHFQLRARCVTDPPWSGTLMRFLCKSLAPVLPLHIDGRNSLGFQLAGLLHPKLRTALLPRELYNKAGLRTQVRIGSAIEAARLSSIREDEQLAQYLRVRTFSLPAEPRPLAVAMPSGAQESKNEAPPKREALIAAVPTTVLRREIQQLAAARCLGKAATLQVYVAAASEIPCTLQEIGRLRELTFRAVGEGTGRCVDLDRFDTHYEHLFVWDEAADCVVGAYRIGRIDAIKARHGRAGLYLDTLFELREPFTALLGPALELGRSFVRPEYQKSFAPLLALWRGIGEYVGREPRYARLIGPVSISNDYARASRELLVRWIRQHHWDPLLASLVRARMPLRIDKSLASLSAELGDLPDLDQLSKLVADFETDGKGVPVLLRQYLKLGGRVLGFNVDTAFADSLDCLLLVDLRRTPSHVLKRYLSDTALASFRRFHRRDVANVNRVRARG